MTATTYVCPQCKKKIVVLIAVSVVRCTTCQQAMTPPARKKVNSLRHRQVPEPT
jgi:ribosomal protein L37AE/L43A